MDFEGEVMRDNRGKAKHNSKKASADVEAFDAPTEQDEVYAQRAWEKEMKERDALDPAQLDALEAEASAAQAAVAAMEAQQGKKQNWKQLA